MKIPLKGAIAKGETTVNEKKQLFFGQPIVDSYLLEESVHYYGIVVHHTAEEDVEQFTLSNLFQDIKTPLKSGNISHYELCWYKDDVEDAKKKLNAIRSTVSDAPRKYIDNTLSVINSSETDS